jgi:hypothetical protein
MSERLQTLPLGFAIDSGEPVSIPLRHMVVTGQTQEAGKTTTLEALISRAEVSAIAFVTKRGESAFAGGRRIEPYFRERADWRFVASVLEATMKERLKFERAWIMRASKGAKTLADVQLNVREAMKTAKGMSADVYLTLDAYLDIVVPRLQSVRFAQRVELNPGLNVLDISDRDRFPVELQSLVMRSIIEWVHEKEKRTITIIPEAWKFIPQGRGSPVKLAAVELIREGAGLQNYVWLDSQDIAGVDKELLRSCPVWLLGVQRESLEIKRVLANIPAGIAKPKSADVSMLDRGQFYACYGRHVIKTYVQPHGMSAEDARDIATGDATIGEPIPPPSPPEPKDDAPMSSSLEQKLDQLLGHLGKMMLTPGAAAPAPATTAAADTTELSAAGAIDEEALYQRFKARLVKEAPALLRVLVVKPEIDVRIERQKIEVDLKSARGMIAKLIADGFFDSTLSANAAWKETKRLWNYGGNSARIYEQCDALVALGFMTKESDGYRAVPDMKVNVIEA